MRAASHGIQSYSGQNEAQPNKPGVIISPRGAAYHAAKLVASPRWCLSALS